MIWIVGGTHEVRELLDRIKSYEDIIVSVTTKEAAQFLPKGLNIHTGKVLREDLDDFVDKYDIDIIIDMTHPFATRISESLRLISEKIGLRLIRYVRPQSSYDETGVIFVESYDACIELLKTLKGNFLFTTGSKNIEKFLQVRGGNRYIFRVLPIASTIENLSSAGVDMKDIVAMVGPFSYEMNVALVKSFEIDYLVTKDSGKNSGTNEKLKACGDNGVKAIVISRIKEDGVDSLDDIINVIRCYQLKK